MNKHIEEAFVLTGGTKQIADLCDVTFQTAHQWRNGERPVPAIRCHAIEKATKGKVSRKELRPLDWHLIWPDLLKRKKSS
jgi:DNA-binding transcriptional regulator YdaS (Cro superfamily)